MAEYVITPEIKALPSATGLMDALHKRGFPVEINLKGSDLEWDAVRFYEPGPPEIECFLSYDPGDGVYTVSAPNDAVPETMELFHFLAGVLLQKVEGRADNPATRERYSAGQFSAKLKKHKRSSGKSKDIFWLFFSWGVVVVGSLVFLLIGTDLRYPALVVLFLSLLSAAGLTYSHFKP
jgi:hypothetical protein